MGIGIANMGPMHSERLETGCSVVVAVSAIAAMVLQYQNCEVTRNSDEQLV